MRPIVAYPWLTESAIAFLEEFLALRETRVLEFGCGGSTLWLAERAAGVTSIEHDPAWAKGVQEQVTARGLVADVILAERPYNEAHKDLPGMFDLVLVDGRERVACAESTYQRVAPGGVLMLDNAERARYAPVAELLATWQHTSAEQAGPRARDGFWYESWKTDWWVRPLLAPPVQ
jgi:predicted O-methyltransferase YrrM